MLFYYKESNTMEYTSFSLITLEQREANDKFNRNLYTHCFYIALVSLVTSSGQTSFSLTYHRFIKEH